MIIPVYWALSLGFAGRQSKAYVTPTVRLELCNELFPNLYGLFDFSFRFSKFPKDSVLPQKIHSLCQQSPLLNLPRFTFRPASCQSL